MSRVQVHGLPNFILSPLLPTPHTPGVGMGAQSPRAGDHTWKGAERKSLEPRAAGWDETEGSPSTLPPHPTEGLALPEPGLVSGQPATGTARLRPFGNPRARSSGAGERMLRVRPAGGRGWECGL